MKFLKSIAPFLIAASSTFATSVDIGFYPGENQNLCIPINKGDSYELKTADNKTCKQSPMYVIGARVLNPRLNPEAKYGFDLVRPFLIIDGIYLDTDGYRTLPDFHEEVEKMGVLESLTELGYTPVLVQFRETVTRSLEDNSKYLAQLLKFMNSNSFFNFINKTEDGIVVMGVSQGGVIGRYGSYLYDKGRSDSDAPIRLFASLDSPHQGAVMPLSLYYTINFWADKGGSSAAEAFRDLIDGPGASGLLLHDYNKSTGSREYKLNTSVNRFLFGEYRKAAEYKGFPSVLVSQGQLKGTNPKHSMEYFKLNRWAKYAGIRGRAESYMNSYENGTDRITKNRIYEYTKDPIEDVKKNPAKFDFVQGSTYPFAETMYKSLRQGFEDAIPPSMKKKIGFFTISLSTGWDDDSLIQKNSTFIPTTSAMDMKCSGELSIKGDCAFKTNSSGFPFANPGSKSSATATYAVDPTHPRYNEAISGRHIESPVNRSGKIDSNVVKGFQVDMWRVLCELSHQDYDNNKKEYRNQNLSWYFEPGVSCMDQTKMPQIIKQGGYVQKKKFAYTRYDYNSKATERDDLVSFTVPAGWHKVATYDNGKDILEGSTFEVNVTVENSKGNWAKAELLVCRSNRCVNQLQMHEINIPLDGKSHKLRWDLPSAEGALEKFRWFRLVLNSEGSNVKVSKAILTKTLEEKKALSMISKDIFPNKAYQFRTWFDNSSVTLKNNGAEAELKFAKSGNGSFIDFGDYKSLAAYSGIRFQYVPGTCLSTKVYFDSYKKSTYSLKNGGLAGNSMVMDIPLYGIINTNVTPDLGLSASRLVFEALNTEEKCNIQKISLF